MREGGGGGQPQACSFYIKPLRIKAEYFDRTLIGDKGTRALAAVNTGFCVKIQPNKMWTKTATGFLKKKTTQT